MAHQQAEQQGTTDSAVSEKMWVQSLADVIRRTDQTAESRMRTMLVCDIKSNKPALYVPPDMAELQPTSLRYIHAFARAHDLKLVEDRRRVEVQPIIEQRDRKPPMIALGLSMLLNQTGAPGAIRTLSDPHRLNADSPHIGIAKLIEMAAFAAPKSKRVVVLPNRMLVNVSDNDTQPHISLCLQTEFGRHQHCSQSFLLTKVSGYRVLGWHTICHACLSCRWPI